MIIKRVAFSTDERYMAALAMDGTLNVWESSSGSKVSDISLRMVCRSQWQGCNAIKSLFFLGLDVIAVVDEECITVLQLVQSASIASVYHVEVIRRLARPCRILCAAGFADGVLLGSMKGQVFLININGVIQSEWSFPQLDDCSQIWIVGKCLLVGTVSGQVALCDLVSGRVKSLYQHPTKSTVSGISVDTSGTWFVAVVVVGSRLSELVVGSTKCLASVFVSPPLDSVTHATFARLSSRGLVVVSCGPTSHMHVHSLDFAFPSGNKIPLSGLEGCFAVAASAKGRLIAAGGVGKGVAVIGTKSMREVVYLGQEIETGSESGLS